MHFGWGTYGAGLLAGLLSTLSPCVLPLLPIILASALQAHRRATWALAAGLTVSYAVLGTSLAWAGAALDIDTDWVRLGGAVLLGALGLVLVSSSLQQRFASATAGLSGVGHALLARLTWQGLGGQFALSCVLGLVWSPCVGPTLGAAVVLASQGTQLLQVAALMGLFGLGAALPLLALAGVSRQALLRWRGHLLHAGKAGKVMLGLVLLALAGLILSGADKPLETGWLEALPDALTQLSTRF